MWARLGRRFQSVEMIILLLVLALISATMLIEEQRDTIERLRSEVDSFQLQVARCQYRINHE